MSSQNFLFSLKENGAVSEKLFDETANAIAKSFCENGRGQVSATQMRRLFDEVKRYNTVIDSSDKWNEMKPYIKMIKSKVAYTVARAVKTNGKAKTYYENLSKFISDGIDQVESEEDYHIFVNLFEAVYGFYYAYAPSKNN